MLRRSLFYKQSCRCDLITSVLHLEGKIIINCLLLVRIVVPNIFLELEMSKGTLSLSMFYKCEEKEMLTSVQVEFPILS